MAALGAIAITRTLRTPRILDIWAASSAQAVSTVTPRLQCCKTSRSWWLSSPSYAANGYISGFVVDDGGAIPNCLVQLFHKQTGICLGRAFSATDGSFRFDDLSTQDSKEYFAVAHDAALAPGAETNFQDDTAIVWTPHGTAQIVADTKHFGRGSVNFVASGDYLTTPSSSVFDISTGAFAFSAWIRPSGTGEQHLFSRSSTSSGISYECAIKVDHDYLMFYHGIRGLNQSVLRFILPTALAANTWQHIEIGRTASGDWHGFINGSRCTNYQFAPLGGSLSFGSVTTGTFNYTQDMGTPANPVTLGAFGGYESINPFIGHMDEMRFIQDDPHTASFTAPTSPYTLADNAHTSSLLHFNPGRYRAVIIDQLDCVT